MIPAKLLMTYQPASGAPLTVWDPANQTGISISDSGHLATATSFAFNGVQSTGVTEPSTSVRKVYMEFPSNTLSDNRGFIGFGAPGASLGGSSSFISINEAGTSVSVQGGGHTVTLGPTAGNNINFAIDFNAKLVWVRYGSGLWNSSGTANPATGVGGFGWSGGQALNAQCTIIDNGGTVAINTGDRSFVNTAPAGFVPWG